MGKLIIFNFDGTSNRPEDAEQGTDFKGAIEDENITNIVKFHLLYGGKLKKRRPAKSAKQVSIYYSGVGTYGNFFQRLYNSGLAKEKFDVAKILRKALSDFDYYFEKGDRVLVTGFSRGAALARRFAALIHKKAGKNNVVEAVFDTVASIGMPDLDKENRPKSEVLFENCTLPANVFKAFHGVALDDKRKAFQPTLMNTEEKVHEIWFTGAHADVGGGYYYDGLADISLRYMLDWLTDLGEASPSWRINMVSPAEIDYSSLVDNDAGYTISPDDVSIDPNVFGKNHQQERMPLVSWITLTDRECIVIKNDKATKQIPKVHHSVAQRIAGDSNYRPQSLKRRKHIIIYDDGEESVFAGMAAHKENALGRLHTLNIGAKRTTVAHAHQRYNHTGIYLQQGASYQLSVDPLNGTAQTWKDSSIVCDANGWDRDDVKLGLKEVAIAGTEPFRRVPEADWFCLCGSIGNTDEHTFRIGQSATISSPKSGELCLFANDLNRFYGNNFGKLSVVIRRLT